MRISEGHIAFSASHAVDATLEGHRAVTAWIGGERVQGSEDVRISISGSGAAARLQSVAAGQGAYSAVGSAAMARVQAMARQSVSHAVRPPVVAPRQLGAGLAASAPRTDTGLSGTERLWLMLVQITGGEEAAAGLADRLARFTQAHYGGTGMAEAFAEVARAHPTADAQVDAQSAAAQSAVAQPNWGYREETQVRVTETEQTSFAAAGVVTTADGRRITVAEAFDLVRSTQAEYRTSIRAGAALHDPLVLQTGVGVPALGPGTQAVDVNADGTAEQVAALAPGSAYLVRDLNGNGLVDSGAELFGPATDDGFRELAAIDSDQNGWIDEADAAWSQLGLWSGETGAAIGSLSEAGVGSIATGSAATPFSYGDAGQLAASGVYLHEDGRAGVVGELNLYA